MDDLTRLQTKYDNLEEQYNECKEENSSLEFAIFAASYLSSFAAICFVIPHKNFSIIAIAMLIVVAALISVIVSLVVDFITHIFKSAIAQSIKMRGSIFTFFIAFILAVPISLLMAWKIFSH